MADSLCTSKIRILDFDASVLAQAALLEKYAKPPYSAQIISFKDIAPSCRYIATKKTLSLVKKRLENSSRNAITLYGSGDFHHISSALIPEESVSVIMFDHHPDCYNFSPCMSCGSWVSNVSKMKNVEKIVLLGPSSEDLSTCGLAMSYLKGVEKEKIEIFPYNKTPSRLYFHYLKDTSCFKVKRDILGSTLYWDNLKGKNTNFIKEILTRIPSKNVYISIDKDCLTSEFALTNWEEGGVSLEWLLAALTIIKQEKNIIGMDITGEYSPIELKNPLKIFLSSLDHPKQPAKDVSAGKISAVNEATNLKILDLFLK
ncbi:MAG: arginase family protein [Candidatus Omnitrophica bacterium]|nr:arginase family protein [Candidatus Omnitrophota bacterium]